MIKVASEDPQDRKIRRKPEAKKQPGESPLFTSLLFASHHQPGKKRTGAHGTVEGVHYCNLEGIGSCY